MNPEGAQDLGELHGTAAAEEEGSHHWHHSERSELALTYLEPESSAEWGGIAISLPNRSSFRLIFAKDGSVSINDLRGHWHLSDDGSLELEVKDGERILKERIWFGKPNLRLRCTVEQFLDGRSGRASFSSEIRRVTRPQATSALSPA